MAPLTDLKPLLRDIVTDMERHVPYASAFAGATGGLRVRVTTREQRVEPEPPRRGVCFTAFNGRHFVESATNQLDPDALRECAGALVRSARPQSARGDSIEIDPGVPLEEHYSIACEIPVESVPLEDKVQLGVEMKDRLHAMDARIVQAIHVYGEVRSESVFVNRVKALSQELQRTQAIAMVILQEGDASAEMYDGRCAQGGFEHGRLTEDVLREIVAEGARILHAPRLRPGTYDCIFSPEFAGIFAHEAFGHGTETDMFLKRRARGQAYLGKPVASPLVNMYDSPALSGVAGSYFFDDEGQPASETQIIRNGVLIQGMTDLNSAVRLGIPRTPNGRRESFERKPYSRMTNTYFGTGEHTFDDMLRATEYGFYLKRPTNGMEDPKGWGIQLEGLYAEEIRGGRLTGRVYTPVIVTGYVPDLLQSITMVGNALHINGLGMCGKGHKEWVKVTDGGPYLKLRARIA